MVLLAPAWKKWGDCTRVKPGTVILHSPDDTVVPIEDSRELIDASGLPGETLCVVGADHFLTDGEALLKLLESVQMFRYEQPLAPGR